jgi:uncharacterized protein YigE (DUF2233 family)
MRCFWRCSPFSTMKTLHLRKHCTVSLQLWHFWRMLVRSRMKSPLGWKSFGVTRLRFLALLSTTVFALLSARAIGAEKGAPCHPVNHDGNSYIVCQFDLRHYTAKLFWKQPNGEPYGSLQNIPRRDGPNGQLVFATNAGMYQTDRTPLGLYVENGRQLVRANTAAGIGNFYIKPNGIFYVSGDSASILDTRKFIQQQPQSDIATQSGPMLVINGTINPHFSPNSDSRKIRNGVGVQSSHQVVFVISNNPVTFSKFAQFFRDALNCSYALYLDGSISSIYAPSVQRADFLWPVGPIIGVYTRSD